MSPSARRPWRHALLGLGALGLATPVAAAGSAFGVAKAGAATPAATTYYVAVGASESLGVQPTAASPRGARTDDGYANALLAIERSHWPGLHLVHFGCPGITAQEALTGGGRCRFGAGSEVAAAVDFIRDNPGRTVLATVDLGFNDLSPCLGRGTIDASCVAAGLERVSRAVPVVLRELRAAGGPRLQIVGLLHNDPYLAAYLQGARGRRFSEAALSVMERLNGVLRAVYARAGALVANVPARFSLGSSSPPLLRGRGRVPPDVVKVCTLSWMCARHNIHLNAAGYRAVAVAIAAALGPSTEAAPRGAAPLAAPAAAADRTARGSVHGHARLRRRPVAPTR